jgi:hypothetical protein
MGSRKKSKKSKKSAAWKDQSEPRFEPAFLGTLNRLVRGKKEPAPKQFLVKVFAKLDEVAEVACLSGPVKVLASRQKAKGEDACCAEAATRMDLVEKVGGLAGTPDGGHEHDPVLDAAEKEHARIETQKKTKTFDMKQLKNRLPKELKGFAGVPALHSGRIAPTCWGLVKLGGSQGVFIVYGTCLETCDKNMLMAFNTKDEPHLDAVESGGKRYWMTRHEDHTLASWRGETDDWLYVLVTHCPFRNALALAQLLRE